MGMMDKKLRQICSFFCAILLISAGQAGANPASQSPYQGLDVHGTIELAKPLAERLYKLFEQQEALLIQAAQSKSDPARIPVAKLAELHAQAWQAEHDARELIGMGEPAGEDLRVRFSLIQNETEKLCRLYLQTPAGKELLPRILKQLATLSPAQEKLLGQADKAIQIGTLPALQAFEKHMLAHGSKLRQLCVFLEPREQIGYWPPFALVLDQGMRALQELRGQQYAEIVSGEVANQIAPAQQFAAETERICSEIAATGQATLGTVGQGDAAQAFAHIVDLWGQAATGLNRGVVLKWTFSNRRDAKVEPSPDQVSVTARDALVAVIDAAVQSAPVDQVARLHRDLLLQLSAANRRCSPRVNLMSECLPALARLAAKDPALPPQLELYRQATEPLLQWKREFATQRAAHLNAGYSSTHKLLYAKRDVDSASQYGFESVRSGTTIVAAKAIHAPANWMIRETSESLLNQQIVGGHWLRATPKSPAMLTPIQAQCFLNSPVATQDPVWLAELRSALLVDDQHGPASIEAAEAISAAESQEYVSVGGTIREIHLEALLTRVITLPDDAYVMFPLGQNFVLPGIVFPQQLTCWRLEIEPAWVQHEYFAFRLEPSVR
jgi:hypothetical protein